LGSFYLAEVAVAAATGGVPGGSPGGELVWPQPWTKPRQDTVSASLHHRRAASDPLKMA
jgi:hypothetical protein